MYVPENYRPDEWEQSHGPEHILYEWNGDKKLATYWPKKEFCDSRGWDQRQTVASYHRKAIGLPSNCKIFISESWKSFAAPIDPRIVVTEGAVFFRLNLVRKWSQYLGWMKPEDVMKIEPVNWSYGNKYQNYKRVILAGHLRPGMPDV